MNTTIQVMLVEDNKDYREVVNLAINEEQDIEIMDQYGTAEIALRSLQSLSAPCPDIILLDLRLPGMSGLDSLRYFREYASEAKVVILTQSDQEADVLRAILLGASGYLLKSARVKEIVDGIRLVHGGGATLDPSVAKFLLQNLQSRLPRENLDIGLSDRELEILKLLSEGLVKKQIAEKLSIGYATVDTHVGHIYEKLHVNNAPSAVGKAYKLGLFPKG
jgi:DNA-binding NarL/FixJ family response regulator